MKLVFASIAIALSLLATEAYSFQINVSLPLEPTYSEVQTKIFNQSCTKCHSGQDADKDIDLSSYDAMMRSPKKLFVAGDPANSLLVKIIASGKMPKRAAPITPELQQLLSDWIKAGAKNN